MSVHRLVGFFGGMAAGWYDNHFESPWDMVAVGKVSVTGTNSLEGGLLAVYKQISEMSWIRW